MQAVTFTLELLEPLLATALEGDPNSGVSLQYVPGSVLRGALIARFLQTRPRDYTFDPANETQSERRLFFDGTVKYLNAYPLVRVAADEEVCTWPTPLSWFTRKDAVEGVDIIFDLWRERASEPFGIEPSEPLRKPFFYFPYGFIETTAESSAEEDDYEIEPEKASPRAVKLFKPELRLAVHTQRNRRHGRAMQDDGAVFRYEAIAAGTRFGGTILCAAEVNQEMIDQIRELLTGAPLTLGGSRTAGYGKTVVTNVSSPADADANKEWREVPVPDRIDAEEDCTITLLSNALVRDRYGHYQADLPPRLLKKALGQVEVANDDFNRTFKRVEIIGGFNRKWGLPLPQTVSLKAGSVFTFKAKAEITAQQLRDVVDAGIGERRVEGFGRITINLNQSYQLEWQSADDVQNIKAQPIKSTNNRTFAHNLLKRILSQQLDRDLLASLGRFEIEFPPPNHQIARLRAVVREALRTKDAQWLTRFFETNRRIAQQHLERAHVLADNQPVLSDGKQLNLKDWITERLQNLDQFNPALPSLGEDRGDIKKVSAEYTESLKREYHLRLIDGVLARAAKENNRRETSSRK